jgi:hypothetical protein
MVRCHRLIALTLLLAGGIALQSSASEVTLETSKEYYYVGETVDFTIANGSIFTIAFPMDPIYTICNDTGTEVFPIIHADWLVFFDPGHWEDFAWQQCYEGGGQVPEGMYYITADHYPNTDPWEPKVSMADTFWISALSSVEPRLYPSWGKIKSLFR